MDPPRCWAMMVRDFGFGLDHLRAFMLNGLDGAWISDADRRRMKREWAAEFDQLRAQLVEEPAPAADHLDRE